MSPIQKRLLKKSLYCTTERIRERRNPYDCYGIIGLAVGSRKNPQSTDLTWVLCKYTSPVTPCWHNNKASYYELWLRIGRVPSTSYVKHKYFRPCILITWPSNLCVSLVTLSGLCKVVMLSKPRWFVVRKVHIYFIIFGTIFLQAADLQSFNYTIWSDSRFKSFQ